MNILLVLENKEVRDKAAFGLEATLGTTVVGTQNAATALAELLGDSKVDALVCEESTDNAKIFKYLVSSGSPMPVILIHRGLTTEGHTFHAFPDLNLLGEVTATDPIEEIANLLRDKLSEHTRAIIHEEHGYVRIRTELLLKVVPLAGDIFIRLSTVKFVKMFRQGDNFDHSDLKRYFHDKKIDYFFVKREDASGFIVQFKGLISNLLAKPEVTLEEAVPVVVEVVEAVQSLANAFGFTPEVQEMVGGAVKLVMKTIRSKPALAALLKILEGMEGGYLHGHSVAVGHLACYLAIKMEWHSDSTFEKLNFAALLHDVFLKTDVQAQVKTKLDLARLNPRLPSAEEDAVLRHPQDAAQAVLKFSELPKDVDTILVQHHERPDGSGFPRGLPGPRISPLATVFIMAHDVLDAFILNKQSPADFIQEHFADYPTGNFRKLAEKILSDPPVVE